MLTAYKAYQQAGGRWLYLGADGFYWVSQYHPDDSNIIEVRKGEAGTRAGQQTQENTTMLLMVNLAACGGLVGEFQPRSVD